MSKPGAGGPSLSATQRGWRALSARASSNDPARTILSAPWPKAHAATVNARMTSTTTATDGTSTSWAMPRKRASIRSSSRMPDPNGSQGEARCYGGPMASVKQFQVTFDCADPERVARFWCEVLGYAVPPAPEGFATWEEFNRSLPPEDRGSWFACADPAGVGPRLFFQRVPEGKVAKNRVHLDVRAGTGLVGEERLATLEAECARLVALGAVRVRLLPADDDNESCIVMQDIEGNEFCLD